MKTQTKHVHYHVHYHGLNKIPPSPENSFFRKESLEPAEFYNEIPEWKEECLTSFIPWRPKLPRYLTQGELDDILAGEAVLWAGRTDRAFLRKSLQNRKLATIITLIVTMLFAIWPVSIELAIFLWTSFEIWPIIIAVSLLRELRFYKHNYYVITPTRVIFIRDDTFYDMKIKDIISWRAESQDKSIGSIYLEDGILYDVHNSLYKIKTFSYVKHLLLSLLAKSSTLNAETIPNIPQLNYCPQCGYNLGEEIHSQKIGYYVHKI